MNCLLFVPVVYFRTAALKANFFISSKPLPLFGILQLQILFASKVTNTQSEATLLDNKASPLFFSLFGTRITIAFTHYEQRVLYTSLPYFAERNYYIYK